MAHKFYVDLQGPPVDAAWLNDVDNLTYGLLGTGGVASTTVAQIVAALGIAPTTAAVSQAVVYPAGTLGNKFNQFVSPTDAPYLAVADFGTTSAATNNIAISAALTAMGANGGTLWIPKGVQWGPISSITWPDETTIVDHSGWDATYSQWTGQVKVYTKTASPGEKNANEFQLLGPWNPAFVADNINTGSPDWHGGLVMRLNGVSDWQLTPDAPTAPGTQRRLQISFYGTYAGAVYSSGTNVFGIDPYDGTFGFNTLGVTGIDYFFNGVRAATFVTRKRALAANGIEEQWGNITNGATLLRQQISGADGSFNYLISNTVAFDFHTATGAVYGSRVNTLPKASNYNISTTDSQSTLTNSASSGVTFTLPAATPGLKYRHVITVGQITLAPASGDKFRSKAVNSTYTSTGLGSLLDIECVIAGVWEDGVSHGGWA